MKNGTTEEIPFSNTGQFDDRDVLQNEWNSTLQNRESVKSRRRASASKAERSEHVESLTQEALDDPENKTLHESKSSVKTADLGESIVQVISWILAVFIIPGPDA